MPLPCGRPAGPDCNCRVRLAWLGGRAVVALASSAWSRITAVIRVASFGRGVMHQSGTAPGFGARIGGPGRCWVFAGVRPVAKAAHPGTHGPPGRARPLPGASRHRTAPATGRNHQRTAVQSQAQPPTPRPVARRLQCRHAPRATSSPVRLRVDRRATPGAQGPSRARSEGGAVGHAICGHANRPADPAARQPAPKDRIDARCTCTYPAAVNKNVQR